MATITLRSTKGSPLTNTEVDNNFSNINTEVGTKLNSSSYTAADVLSKLLTVDGLGSGLDADLLDGLTSASTNTASTVVVRDASGNFSAGTITAALTGTASIASSLNFTVTVGGGGTGSTTAAGARTNLGLVIGTDVQAYDADLAAIAALTTAADRVPYYTGASTAALATFTAAGRTIVGSADIATARSNLGLTIGTNVQAYDSNLAAIAGIATAGGIYTKTAAGTAVVRSLAASTGITISNADGVAGNPTISVTSYVSSVQGNTGAVIVSVPVTSVQSNTGAVIVTNISGNSGTTSAVAWTNVQARPTALSQFSNDQSFTNAASNPNFNGQIRPVFTYNVGHQNTNCTTNVNAAVSNCQMSFPITNCNNCGDFQCNYSNQVNHERQGTTVAIVSAPTPTANRFNCNCNC